ncbi:MAG: extracellular solute-binding protein, partial [Oscillospiraceae bacterium]|nr:extracellular solute-binding protein [Oscillospiraceae bacterium]
MKKLFALLLALAMVFSLAACGGGNNAKEGGTYDITVWVPELAVDLTKTQIENFNSTNEYGIKFNATVEPVSEAVAANNMVTDVEAGGDIFFFAQDQFARLVQAGALNKLGAEAAATVTAANDAGVVKAATSGSELFAYPLTSDNGYFMYYDKSVIPEEDVDSLEKLIADCEAAGKYFAFEANTSAWYIASWFFATGCVSEWITDDDGKFISIKDTFNSPEGLISVKGMKKLVDSPMHLSSS